MSNTLAEFDDKFDVANLLVAESDFWRWSVRPVHSTLGAGILSLKRFCTSMSDLTTAEAKDLATITKLIESRLAEVYQPDKMNYLMLMMVDNHLHFHVLPRYGTAREFAGRSWEDQGWPALPEMGANSDLAGTPLLAVIRDALR